MRNGNARKLNFDPKNFDLYHRKLSSISVVEDSTSRSVVLLSAAM